MQQHKERNQITRQSRKFDKCLTAFLNATLCGVCHNFLVFFLHFSAAGASLFTIVS
jgi:hypothetical protein